MWQTSLPTPPALLPKEKKKEKKKDGGIVFRQRDHAWPTTKSDISAERKNKNTAGDPGSRGVGVEISHAIWFRLRETLSARFSTEPDEDKLSKWKIANALNITKRNYSYQLAPIINQNAP